MTHIITSLCLRDGGCVDVCPVECIVPGKPQEQWPWYYIDPDTCIDCGACIPECPYEAIFTEDETPDAYEATGGEYQSMPAGTAGFETAYAGEDHHGREVQLASTKVLEAGEVVDLTADIKPNYDFFEGDAPGYWDGWTDFVNP
ncbi:MAG: 4Fe-4S dicluster domain-containing protein [Chloroflexi bacterium]|nr:MAG: 4Fe-4S dicluster domain-containing protein [Chloroflexota bacterium]MBL1196850.1 4Fe-4S dicluster domain-containing protein [Chloroflexota bacterium]NOH14145.1 ferredoxin family protein [Chloroflexota bacterium]